MKDLGNAPSFLSYSILNKKTPLSTETQVHNPYNVEDY